MGPLIEPLMLCVGSDGGTVPEFAPPDSDGFTGDHERRFEFACSFGCSGVLGCCITDRRNFFAFSRETATLIVRRFFEREKNKETRSSSVSAGGGWIGLM